MAQTEFYTLQDDDVTVFQGYILVLTEQGAQNITGKSIIIPETLDGQKVVGIYNINNQSEGFFTDKNLQYVKLPKTIEYIGNRTFAYNYDMLLCNLNELINLRHIGVLAFAHIKGIDNPTNPHIIDFSNLAKLEKIGDLAFLAISLDSINELDFSNCTNLRSIGVGSFISKQNHFAKINFSNCSKLSYIQSINFTSNLPGPWPGPADTTEAITTEVIFSNCKSLVYIAPWVLGISKQQMESLIPKLPTPEIANITFDKWTTYTACVISGKIDFGLLATFKEKVISITEFGEISGLKNLKNTPKTYDEMLTALNQQKNTKDSAKEVKFSIQSHSVGEVSITNIHCNLSHCTLSWTSGTIASGAMQEVTVTYPDTTTNFTATVTIEGENLMGNTTVFIDDKGGVTTDDNLQTAIAPNPNTLQEDEIKLYPNPATNLLNIEFSKKQVANEVTIVNLQGETVYENFNFEGSALDISGLPLGVYVVKVNGMTKIFVKN